MNIGKNSSNKENCPPNFKKYTISYHHTLLLLFSGQSCPTLCDPMDCSTPGHPALTISQSLPKFLFTASVMPSSHLILWRLLLLPSIFPSIRIFQWVFCAHQMMKILELQLQHQSFQWIFRVDLPQDWFELLAVQGTFRSLLQHHSSKASILWCPVFFQLSHLYVTTGKTIGLTIRTFVGRVMSLLFNRPSRFVLNKRSLYIRCP